MTSRKNRVRHNFRCNFRGAARRVGAVLLGLAVCSASVAAEPGAAPGRETTPKLTAPIGIDYKLAGEPAVGEALELTLSITALETMAEGTLTLGSEDSLAVIAPTDDVDLGTLGAGEAREVAVTLIPLTAGTQYLSVSVTSLIRGEPQTRSIAVAVRVPEATLRKSDDGATGNKTETVRSFRAVETVR